MSDAKNVVATETGKGAKRAAKKPKVKIAKAKKGVRPPKQFHPDVVEACQRYGAANEGVGKAEGSAELAKWTRAAEAHSIMVAAQKHKQAYIAAAVKLCGVRRSIVTMDCKAELMRQALRIEPKELPKDSLSAFYELHRAQEAALAIASEDEQAKAAALAKVKKVGKALVAGDCSVRQLRAEFKDEFSALREARKRKAAGTTASKTDDAAVTLPPPVVQRMNAKVLKVLVNNTAARYDFVPVITITTVERSSKAIEESFANQVCRDALAAACPAAGPLWILVDLGAARDNAVEPIELPAGDEAKSAA